MITITENMISDMYNNNSRNVEAVGNEYGIYANTVEMKGSFGDTELTITIYSKFTDYRKVKEMIFDGVKDVNVIFDECSYTGEIFTIECDEEYTLEVYTYGDKPFEHTKEFLNALQENFSGSNEYATKEHIEYMIEEYEENNKQ